MDKALQKARRKIMKSHAALQAWLLSANLAVLLERCSPTLGDTPLLLGGFRGRRELALERLHNV